MVAEGPLRILYIEDDPGTARLMQRQLERAGYQVDLARDGREGLRIYETGSYKVLLVDHNLPEMTGLAVIRELASREKLPPSIMITGAGDETVAVEAMKLGADDYVIKDVEARYLALIPSVVAKALNRRRLIEAKLQAEEALQAAHDALERRVEERTAELIRANQELRTEILERQRAEQALRQSEERFRAIFETAPDAIFLKDRSLAYTLVNPATEALLGLRAPQIQGRTDQDLFDKESASRLRQLDKRVLEGETLETQHHITVGGKRLSLLSIRVPLRDIEGKIVGLCVISRDMTARTKLLEDPLPAHFEYRSDAMRTTMAAAQTAARNDSVVLLTGESGTGKDFLARYIHDHSSRSDGPFIAINCATIPSGLAESEFFGYERGAFTGAQTRSRGMLELAEGGTLLLNEIGELPLQLQAKLLSFLDTWSFVRVGGRHTIKVDIRLITATNRELDKEVAEERFRADLFYRLNVFSIHVPPLRERREDIPLLAERLLTRLATELQLSAVPGLDARASRDLTAYDWPGNVRELRNVLERALICSEGNPLELEGLRPSRGVTCQPDWSYDLESPGSLDSRISEFTRSLIERALDRCGGNKNDAAHLLGISRHSLRRRMMTVGLVDNSSENRSDSPVRIRRTTP